MPSNPEKVIGNSGPCAKCGKTIFCNANTYNNETKPQWQNQDGKAHYTKEGNCKDGGSQAPQTQPTKAPQDFKDFKPVLVTPEEAKIWIDIVNKCSEYTKLAQIELSDIENPALKGLITKVSFEVLGEIQERQARSKNE